MKALITGGAGFIGSHLADRLVERGDQVVLLDDLSTGRSANIDHLNHRDDAEFVLAAVGGVVVGVEEAGVTGDVGASGGGVVGAGGAGSLGDDAACGKHPYVAGVVV